MSSRRMKSMACHMAKMAPRQVFRVPSRKSKGTYIPLESSLDSPTKIQDERSMLLSNGHSGKIQIAPRGFMAVYVGPEQRKFVIPTRFLSIPDFLVVMDKTAEEFGYEQEGGLRITCDEHDFEELIASCSAACKIKSKSLSGSGSVPCKICKQIRSFLVNKED